MCIYHQNTIYNYEKKNRKKTQLIPMNAVGKLIILHPNNNIKSIR